MRKKLWIVILMLWANALSAQVYPGDANRSGRVDQQDMLYIGYAYGAAGPSRVIAGTAFTEMPIALEWAEAFPGGISYAYADANGDGQVNITDMLTVISNYGLEHTTPITPVYPPAFPGIDPTLQFGPGMPGLQLTAGSAITIPIALQYPGPAHADINGLAFSIDFDKSYIRSITLSFATTWMGGPAASFRFQNIDPQQIGQLDVATTRYGVNGFPAEGEVGVLSIIIEDDLISFMEGDSAEVLVKFSEIMLVDEELALQPVNSDSVLLTVYNPNYLTSSQKIETRTPFRCFPNPVQGGRLNLAAPHRIYEARFYDMLGREVYRLRSPGARNWTIQLPGEWPAGYYLLKAHSEGGRINEQLLFIP